ncbi:hypothetical protein [Deinococcus sp.]|uniref:hypothetical protein n=1 Tax=Deinococcus sp. TaxID=47478 RepID=UPI003C7BAB90
MNISRVGFLSVGLVLSACGEQQPAPTTFSTTLSLSGIDSAEIEVSDSTHHIYFSGFLNKTATLNNLPANEYFTIKRQKINGYKNSGDQYFGANLDRGVVNIVIQYDYAYNPYQVSGNIEGLENFSGTLLINDSSDLTFGKSNIINGYVDLKLTNIAPPQADLVNRFSDTCAEDTTSPLTATFRSMRVLDINGTLVGVVKERLMDQSRFNPESQVVRFYSDNAYSWYGYCNIFLVNSTNSINASKGWNALFMQFNGSDYQFDIIPEDQKTKLVFIPLKAKKLSLWFDIPSISFIYGSRDTKQLNAYTQYEGYYIGYVDLSTDIPGLNVSPSRIILSGQNRNNKLNFTYTGDKKISNIFHLYAKDDKGQVLSTVTGNLSVQ